jgi:transposase
MATERLTMRHLREILRQKWDLGRSHREVAQSLGLSHGAVGTTILRARAAELDWPQVQALADDALEARLYGRPEVAGQRQRPQPDCAYLHAERRKPGVTLELLHLEYLEQHPDGYRYTRFCDLYRAWLTRRGLSMRQVHRAGEKCFVDYAGQKPRLIEPATGEIIEVELFVAVLGASNYTYAEATRTQQVPDWIASHQRAFAYFGGVTTAVVPDQLRSGVTRPCRYEPGLQRTYEEFAQHYGTAILPARPGKARDKPKASYCCPFLHGRRTPGIAAAVAEALAGVSPRQRAGGRLEEDAARIIGAPAAEHAFAREALGGGVMHPELRGDLGTCQPPRGAEVLGQARDPVRLPDHAHQQTRKGLTRPGSQRRSTPSGAKRSGSSSCFVRPCPSPKLSTTAGTVDPSLIRIVHRAFESWAHLNQLAEQWLREEADRRIHGTVHEVVAERFAREAPRLRPLPGRRYDTAWESRQVGWDVYVEVWGSRYSVPAALAGQRVTVRISLDGVVAIYEDEQLVAQHVLQAGAPRWVTVPEHHAALWAHTLEVERRPLAVYEEVAQWN